MLRCAPVYMVVCVFAPPGYNLGMVRALFGRGIKGVRLQFSTLVGAYRLRISG